MARNGIRAILLLAAVVGLVVSEYSPDICTFVNQSCGLVPPILPRNFELKGEHVDSTGKYAVYEEMYFDYTYSRGKYMYLLNGIERHFLFDYEVWQIIHYNIYHPGIDIKKDPLSKACVVEAMEDSPYKFIFGYIDEFANHPKMYTSNEALRFGGPYRFAAKGSDVLPNRGLPVNEFRGCVYDSSMDITMDSNFSFSDSMTVTAGGTQEKDVTGVDNGILSVPLKMKMRGAMPSSQDEDAEMKMFNKTMSISWFKGEPEFKLGTFQIPPWMHCEGFMGRQDIPPLPTAFSTRIQVTSFSVDILGEIDSTEVQSYEELYYYKEKKLARRDYTPDANLDTEIKNKFGSLLPVRTVFDFNEGLIYVTNKVSGRCYIRPIVYGDYFETTKDSLFTEMATPEEIFKMHAEEMEYKGTHFARDIDCDVYNGKYYDKALNTTFQMETYFSTNGWHEDADDIVEYGVPVRHSLIRKDLDADLVEYVTTMDFLKFKAKTPFLRFFDVSNCIEGENRKDFALSLTLNAQSRQTIFYYKSMFLDTAQFYLTDISQVMTPLRVQRMQLRRVIASKNRTFLMFTLVDKINLKTQVAVGQKGANLDDAVVFLQKFVDTGRFVIQFNAPGSQQATLIPAKPGALYVRTSSGNLQFLPPLVSTPAPDEIPTTDATAVNSGTKEAEEEEGMSSGSLALLALAMLFIGIGVGIAIMYLYVRYYSERQMDDRIALSSQQKTITLETNIQEVPQ